VDSPKPVRVHVVRLVLASLFIVSCSSVTLSKQLATNQNYTRSHLIARAKRDSRAKRAKRAKRA